MAYRFVYGNLCVITMEIASRNNQNNFIDYTFECERRLLEEIKKGDMENSIDALLKLLSDISALDYSNITLSIMHLLNSLKTTFDTLEVKALKATQVDFNDTHSIETIDQLYFILSKVIQEIIEKKDSRVDEKHMIIVDAVKGIVIQNYNNSNLCLQYIASLLKLSPVVLGKVFKENTMMTVAEYITDVRLNTAVELLEILKDSVQHIMVSVGIENESYFYKLFKKKFGVTPKEYVLKKTIKNVFK